MAVFTAIATAIATSLGMALAATATATFIAATAFVLQGLTMIALTFGGSMLAKSLSKGGDFTVNSPTYSAIKQTQTNPDLPIPLLYGTVKLAGNRIWQDDETKNGIKRIVAFSEGEITDITDIRLNDNKSTDISGIKIQKFYGTATQELPDGLKAENVGSLKNIAYLYVNVPKGEKIDINYNLTAIVKGKKVRVYTTPTKYEIKYSENPAWILFDFLTAYNGRGLCLNDNGTLNEAMVAQMFDMNSFIEAAAYCDTEVFIDGKSSKRFTFNMIFDSQTSHRSLLDEIYRNCRGVLCVKNGKLQFKIDKAETTKKVFTEKDIINGSEVFQTLPYEEHYDILKIDYISPEHEWNKVQAFAELPKYRDGVPIEHNVNCYSVTNFQQASRLAWYYINSKVLCPYFGSFKTGFKAFDLEVGDVIQIPVILMGLTDYLVKVTSVINNGTGTYTVNYRTYNPELYTDELGSKEPTVLVTTLTDKYNYLDDVKNFNVVQKDNYYMFSWQYNNDTDVYEIRYGDEWETGEIIGKNIALNNFTYQIRTKGLKTFWIKAKNDYNYSENPTMDVINISDIPQTNVIVNYHILEDLTGTFENTKIYNGYLKLKELATDAEILDGNVLENSIDGNDLIDIIDGNIKNGDILWQNTNNYWGFDSYYQNGGIWGANVYTEGSYTSPVYDLGESVESYVNPEINYYCVDELADCLTYWRYSDDGENWTDWKEILQGQYTFRYSRYKVVLTSPNAVQIICQKFNVSVDVPDRFKTMEIDVTSTNGLVVDYDFYAPPAIVATVNDSITAYAVVTSKTKKQAKILVYNNNGTATTGKVSLYLKGY
jgi:hypothetical protein